jgi:hypothetical protein
MPHVEVSNVSPTQALHQLGDRVIGPGRHKQVHVVGHQDVRVERAARPITGVAEQFTIALKVLGRFETARLVVSALNDVHGYAGDNHTSLSRHATKMSGASESSETI